MIPPGADYCPDCGAPADASAHTEGSDAEINPELARANLLRMRGDYKKSEDVCLAILRRFPNNLSANTLLGDICAESGDLDRAVEWYELALDLQSDSTLVQTKLDGVRQRKADHEAATTAKLLGLPTTRPKGAFVAVATLAFIVCIGVVAFWIGRGYTGPPSKPDLSAPVNVPDTADHAAAETPQRVGADGTASAPFPGRPKEDRELLELLARDSLDGSRLIDAFQDPRSKDVVLTFSVQASEDERAPAARLAAAGLEAVAAAPKVTVRAVRNGRTAMVADVTREDFVRATSAEWKDAHQDAPEAWIDEVLTNVWRLGA